MSVRLVGVLVALAVLVFAGMSAVGWHQSEKARAIDAAKQSVINEFTVKLQEAAREADQERAERIKRTAALDAEYQAKLASRDRSLASARAELRRVRDALHDSEGRLRAREDSTPASSFDAGEGAELSSTGAAVTWSWADGYFRLADEADAVVLQLTGLQTYVREVCLKEPKQ